MDGGSAAVSRAGWLRPHAEQLPDAPDIPGAGRTVGVLALQGAFAEHAMALRRLGAAVVEVRTPAELARVDSIVMPGGESTTISKLLATSGLFDPIRERLAAGMACLGTCAGMILLAVDVLDGRPDQRSFAALDISVRRNGYGRQRDSFETDLVVSGLCDSAERDTPVHAVFIRAPRVTRVGPDVEVLARHGDDPVLVRSARLLASAFHPELTPDLRIHRLFLSLQTTDPVVATDPVVTTVIL